MNQKKKNLCLLLLAVICLFSVYMALRNTDCKEKPLHGSKVEQQEDSAVVKTDAEKRIIPKVFKTKTGKSIIINETHPIGMSLSDVDIITKGFRSSQTIHLGELDPIIKISLLDLDENGFEEIYIFTRSVGSGSGGDFFVYASDKDEILVRVKTPELTDKDYSGKGLFNGYMGHDFFFFEKKMLIREFPIYKENDSNANPTGGRKRIYYMLKGDKLVII